MRRRVWGYVVLARFHSPAGGLLLLWPTMWGLWLAAEGWPGWKWLGIFVGGVVAMRAFGCTINDIADRRLDAQVARTKNRPLAAGDITVAEAAMVACFFLLAAFLLWLLLPTAAKLWSLAALFFAALYPLAKRWTRIPQAWLAAAFGFGILVAHSALNESAPPLWLWGFFVANWLWVLAYDTVYAMCDREDDMRAGIKSSALLFGDSDVKIVGGLYAAAIVLLSGLGIWRMPESLAYQVALIAAMLLAFRLWFLYRGRRPDSCFLAFKLNHWFGAFVWAGIAAAFW